MTRKHNFEREAFPKALRDRVRKTQKRDAEIELTIENQGDINTGFDQSTEFHTSVSITMARLSALIDIYKRSSDGFCSIPSSH